MPVIVAVHTSAKTVNGLIAVVLESATLKDFILAEIFSHKVKFEINLLMYEINIFQFFCEKRADSSVYLRCGPQTVNCVFLSFIIYIPFLYLHLLLRL